MTTLTPHSCFNQAICQKSRQPENVFDQMTHIIFGIFRVIAILLPTPLMLTAVLILFVLCYSPANLAQLRAAPPKTSIEAAPGIPPYLAGEWDEDVIGPIQTQQDATAAQPATPLLASPRHQLAWQQEYDSRVHLRKQALELLRLILLTTSLLCFAISLLYNIGRFTSEYHRCAKARYHAVALQHESSQNQVKESV